MKKKKILYCGYGFVTNIGNSFIDYGVEYSIKKVAPDMDFISVSNLSWFLKNVYRQKYHILSSNSATDFDLREEIDADIYVFAGSLFNSKWVKTNGKFLAYLSKNSKKVLIFGGSGGDIYSKHETDIVKQYFNDLDIIGFISRDTLSYESYCDISEKSYNGIDCGFFVNDAFKVPNLKLDAFCISNFDHIMEPCIDYGKNVIRLDHNLWAVGRINNLIKHPKKSLNVIFNKDLYSDYPGDYLALYANCDEVYSDRVHACVATLAYGNEAKHFGKSPRSNLFDRVGLKKIKKQLVRLDANYLNDEKDKQLEVLKDILNY